jgi:putative ABC transport system permease protein
MKAIDRKVFRDLMAMKAQLLAIGLVLTCGVGLFVGLRTTMRSLETARARYYAHERFAHVFATCSRAPERLQNRIRRLPGVTEVETRVRADVTLDVPGMVDAAAGRLLSLPDLENARLNRVRLRQGRLPEPGRSGEVVASEPFVDAHGFDLGAQLGAVIDGKQQTLTIVGVGLSPEYIYGLGPGQLFPDDRRFGVFWMRREPLAAALDLGGAFNDVSLRIARGTEPRAVLEPLDDLLRPYGGVGAVERADQQSAFFIDNELAQLRTMGTMTPSLFLVVTAFLLNMVTGRIVAGQREEIAALKALGYLDREVAFHFAKLIGLVVAAGSLAGLVVGGWLGSAWTSLYQEYYRFPDLPWIFATNEVVLVLLVTGASAAAGTATVILHVLRLPPAEAMRPVAPPSYRATLVERLGLSESVPAAARIVLRELERKPLRALFSVTGIALATALVVVSTFAHGSIYHLMMVQFGLNQREDVFLTLAEPRDLGVLGEVEKLPGVLHAEPVRDTAIRLRKGPRRRDVGLRGIRQGTTLQALLDVSLREVDMPSEGLVLSRKLAEVMGVGAGDFVDLEVLEGARPRRDMIVSRVVESYVGLGAWIDMDALARLLREPATLNGAWLAVDELAMSELHAEVKRTPMIAGITERDVAVRNLMTLMDENLGTSIVISLVFSLVMAFGVLYNAARIALAERSRELASLRVLGFRRQEVAAILLGELALLTTVAVPTGLLLGYGLAAVMTQSSGFNNEQFQLPLVVTSATFALAVLTVLVAGVVSGWSAWRRLDAIPIVQVLKARD